MLYSKIKYLVLITIIFFSANVLSEEDKYAPIRGMLPLCFSCHGENGASKQVEIPILAEQEFYYMYVQLKDMKKKLRDSPVMTPLVANISKANLRLLAEFFAEQSWPETNYTVTAKQAVAGQMINDAGQCAACHLGTLKGNSRVPRIANQHPDYLKNTMLDFKHDIRKNAPSIAALFKTYSDQEIEDVANYLASFGK